MPKDIEVYRLASDDGDDLVLFVWGPSGSLVPARGDTRDAPESPKKQSALSPAESDVLQLVLRGASNAEIAKARGRSVRTIANQVASLLRKLGVESRFELMSRVTLGRTS